jgi:hypothetical protein
VPEVKAALGAEQEHYARWLERGSRVGFALLVVGLLVYVTEMIEPHVPIGQLPALWTLPAERFLQVTGISPGWGWAALAHRSDLMNLAGIAVLAGCSILPLGAALAAFRARGERTFAVLCALQIAVLLLAASGLLTGGH